MREMCFSDDGGPILPLSQQSVDVLRWIAAGNPTVEVPIEEGGDGDGWDADLARRYAAFLLRERGLA